MWLRKAEKSERKMLELEHWKLYARWIVILLFGCRISEKFHLYTHTHSSHAKQPFSFIPYFHHHPYSISFNPFRNAFVYRTAHIEMSQKNSTDDIHHMNIYQWDVTERKSKFFAYEFCSTKGIRNKNKLSSVKLTVCFLPYSQTHTFFHVSPIDIRLTIYWIDFEFKFHFSPPISVVYPFFVNFCCVLDCMNCSNEIGFGFSQNLREKTNIP